MVRTSAFLLLGAAALAACAADAPDPTEPDDLTVPVFDRGGVPGHVATQFRAAGLKGRNEIPANESRGAGAAVFSLDASGTSLHYRLIVANIDDVTQSHIHLGQPDENGPIVAFLFGFEASGVTVNGVLAEGTIEANDLVGPLAGEPLSVLVEAIRAGSTYTNVHTIELPPGEIRAQIH
jgi:hypothetical protein